MTAGPKIHPTSKPAEVAGHFDEFDPTRFGRLGFVVDLLSVSLQAAVPLLIAEMREVSDEHRLQLARRAVDVICEHGDDLQFGGKHCAAAFNAVARGLAAGAYQPGGITFLGLHWCAAGCACPTAHEQHRAIHTVKCGHDLPDDVEPAAGPVRPTVVVEPKGDLL